MFCDQCGVEVPEGVAFCPNCGNRLINDNTQAAEEAQTIVWNGHPEKEQEKEYTEEPKTVEEPETAGEPETGNETGQEQNIQRRFCPNCGTENSMEDTFCKECGMPLDGTAYSVSAVGQGMQMNQPPTGAKTNKKKGLIIGICVAAAVLVLAVIVTAVRSVTMGPRGKVIQAVTATMKETPEVVGDLKAAGDILSESSYTLGFTMEVDGDTVSGELRNSTKDKQIYLAADVDSEKFDLLCGVHSGVLKAAISEGDYMFMYDPKRENDGYLCEQMRKKEIEQLNSMLENITSDKVSSKELQKELMAAFLQESEELEFKEAKAKEFEVDGKDRECKGYKVRINEKNIARFVENAGEIMTRRMPEALADEFADDLDDMVDEIKEDDFDADITFYLYKKKLAAVILEIDDYGDEEWVIEFQGGDYRMQNVLISLKYDGDTYGEMEISSRKKGSVETISIESDTGEDITITYDTKSGRLSLEYDDDWTECFIEGIYKHSGSEVSFMLEEFEIDGDSLVEDEDVSFTIYAKKPAEIQKYDGTEFDLGGADEDDFEDLIEDLKDSSDLFEELFYDGNRFMGLSNLFYYTGAGGVSAPAAEAPAAEAEW